MISDSSTAARILQEGFALIPALVNETDVASMLVELENSGAAQNARRRHGTTFAIRNPLQHSAAAHAVAATGPLAGLARMLLGPAARPVRSIFFDKSPDANWKVTWHQDLSIAVRGRVETPGYGPWSERDGFVQVRPPREVLDHIVTLRLNLDACGEDDGPLLIAPRTHSAGVIPERDIDPVKLESTAIACTGNVGDVVAMKPLVIHSSRESRRPTHRRVLHVEYAAINLPDGLTWASDQPA